MSEINLDLADAIELAEALNFIADWLSGSQHQSLAESLTAFVGTTSYDAAQLAADLHRFVFLLGLSDGEQLFGEPTP